MGPRRSRTTPKTVKRVIDRHEAGGSCLVPASRGHTYDAVVELGTARVDRNGGRISAKRLLPPAQAVGYEGSGRNFRRLGA